MRTKMLLPVVILPFLLFFGCSQPVVKPSVISIKTRPAGANVQVNKKLIGPSPVTVTSPGGDAEIVATKGEYTGKVVHRAAEQQADGAGRGSAREGASTGDTELTVTLNGQLEVGAFKIGAKDGEEDLETALEVLYKLKNPTNTIVIYDASGSMRWPLSPKDKTSRYIPAQKAITDFINKGNTDDYYGLVVFGTRTPSGPEHSKQREKSCGEIELVLAVGKLDKRQMIDAVTKLKLRDHRGDTPVEQALRFAAGKLKDRPGEKKIVLVTDGYDECGGEADRGAREAAKLGIKVYTLAFGIGIDRNGRLNEALASEVRQVLRDCANAGGGLFFDTRGADDLYRAMIKVELDFFSFKVFDRAGKEVLKGKLGQRFFLDPGVYNVVFQTEKPFAQQIEVRPAQKTKTFIAISGEHKPEIRSVIE